MIIIARRHLGENSPFDLHFRSEANTPALRGRFHGNETEVPPRRPFTGQERTACYGPERSATTSARRSSTTGRWTAPWSGRCAGTAVVRSADEGFRQHEDGRHSGARAQWAHVSLPGTVSGRGPSSWRCHGTARFARNRMSGTGGRLFLPCPATPAELSRPDAVRRRN